MPQATDPKRIASAVTRGRRGFSKGEVLEQSDQVRRWWQKMKSPDARAERKHRQTDRDGPGQGSNGLFLVVALFGARGRDANRPVQFLDAAWFLQAGTGPPLRISSRSLLRWMAATALVLFV